MFADRAGKGQKKAIERLFSLKDGHSGPILTALSGKDLGENAMSLSRVLVLWCLVLAGCSEQGAGPKRDAPSPAAQAITEDKKLKDRREMMELWEKWDAKNRCFRFYLDNALRFQFSLPEEAKKSNNMAHKLGEEIDRLDALSRDKYGVPCEQLPRLLKP